MTHITLSDIKFSSLILSYMFVHLFACLSICLFGLSVIRPSFHPFIRYQHAYVNILIYAFNMRCLSSFIHTYVLYLSTQCYRFMCLFISHKHIIPCHHPRTHLSADQQLKNAQVPLRFIFFIAGSWPIAPVASSYIELHGQESHLPQVRFLPGESKPKNNLSRSHCRKIPPKR